MNKIASAILILLLSVGAASSSTPYPADVSPTPLLAYGTLKLRSTYTGAAMTACKTSCTSAQSVSFIDDNLDTTTLDTFLGGAIGQVSAWNDQMGTGFTLQGTALESPSIQNLAIGGARSLVFQGGSQSGAIYWLQTSDITARGMVGNTWTIMAVIAPSSSQFYNQVSGFSSGALANLYKTDGTSLAEILNQSQAGGSTSGPGAWEVKGGALDFQSPGYMVPVNPQVLTITSGAHGTRVYVNEQVRATASQGSLSDTIGFLRIGALAASTPGANGHSFDGQVTAFMLWNSELTESQSATTRAALYDRFSIDQRVTDFNSYSVAIMGDSIAAGYVTLGIYGYAQYLPALLNHPTTTRVINNAIPGSTISDNPIAVVPYASTIGLFPTTVPLQVPQSKLGRVVVIHGGGNDALIGPAPRSANTHSSTLIDNITDTSDLSVGDFVHVSGLSILSTIQSKTAHSITIDHATTTTSAVSLLFTNAGNSPTVVYNDIKSLATSSVAAGSGVVVSTVLPRDTTYQSYVAAVDALLTGSGVPGATVVDCASFPGLNTNPGPDYTDAVHPSALGHQHMAACLAPAINALMP